MGLRHSSWGLNNRNTSRFPLGQRSGGSFTCVWSQIPSCLFSQSGIEVHTFHKRLWKRKTILSLLPFFISPVDVLLLKTKTQQKLCVCMCVCACASFEREFGSRFCIVCSCNFIEKVKKEGGKKLSSYVQNVRVGWYKLLQSNKELICFSAQRVYFVKYPSKFYPLRQAFGVNRLLKLKNRWCRWL